jgi:hypothetical protein
MAAAPAAPMVRRASWRMSGPPPSSSVTPPVGLGEFVTPGEPAGGAVGTGVVPAARQTGGVAVIVSFPVWALTLNLTVPSMASSLGLVPVGCVAGIFSVSRYSQLQLPSGICSSFGRPG